MSKLKWSSFIEKMGEDWAEKFYPFFLKGGFDPIYEYLKAQGSKGVKIAPDSSKTYRAFLETPLHTLRVVMMGISPYHTFKGTVPIADGLMMSCENNKEGELQPSLFTFYQAVEQSIYNGLNLNMEKSNSLSYLAKEGVLLTNVALTVPEGKALAHNHIWEPFTNYLIEEILNPYTRGLVYILMGKEAHKFEKKILPFSNYVFCIEHPVASSYRGDGIWKHENIFQRVNEILTANNGVPINWVLEKAPF